eukprot:TRINITY_DN66828_c4_g1_i1.p3 TRINITY_DN66828_c4_g1~~TRINITY_DN66828_c4_g1_i1.p3  ORF type:complete len:118 (+),score=0.10 TRINITY_DN66828_c4_g1_i1:841-1194(+)
MDSIASSAKLEKSHPFFCAPADLLLPSNSTLNHRGQILPTNWYGFTRMQWNCWEAKVPYSVDLWKCYKASVFDWVYHFGKISVRSGKWWADCFAMCFQSCRQQLSGTLPNQSITQHF